MLNNYTSNVFKLCIDNKEYLIETSKYAQQANASCLISCCGTSALITVCMNKQAKVGADFFPLQVEYEEKMYAVGKIPGGYKKRESKPTDGAILSARLIDRSIRPLFEKNIYNDVVVTAQILSVDDMMPPEILSIIGTSVALSISDIPWNGPIGSVCISKINNEYIINATNDQKRNAECNIVVTGTKNNVLMLEGICKQIPRTEILNIVQYALKHINEICDFIANSILPIVGKEKIKIENKCLDDLTQNKISEIVEDKINQLLLIEAKKERSEYAELIIKDTIDILTQTQDVNINDDIQQFNQLVTDYINKLIKEKTRRRIIDNGIRPDGREYDDIRNIWCETHILKHVHGSAIFTRGETQTLATCTLGILHDAQKLEGLNDETEKRYIHHYNFPGYAVGEAKGFKATGRREIGHGALAERALINVIPSELEFPYTIRVVNDILSSNGSSSMASVCGSTLALMDAGVKIIEPVSGVAMGLIKDDKTNSYVILTDIQGIEDAYGDMDFKIAGTKNGITAIQMDIKIEGLSINILEDALNKADIARMKILDKMLECISAPRSELSEYAPKIITFVINPQFIGNVIGSAGKTINQIIQECNNVEIDIQNDGQVSVSTYNNIEWCYKAKNIIEHIVNGFTVNEIVDAKIIKIDKYKGVICELVPNIEGFIPKYFICTKYITEKNIGDIIKVKVINVIGSSIKLKKI